MKNDMMNAAGFALSDDELEHIVGGAGGSSNIARVDPSECSGCGACVAPCPMEAIQIIGGKAQISGSCVACGACVPECPPGAITC